MRLATHQPQLFPSPHFWAKLANVDVLGLLVDVPFDHGGYQNRVQLCDGWLTLPVSKETRSGLIYDVQLADNVLARDLLKTIRGRMPKKQFPWLERLDDIFLFLDGWQYRSFALIAESLLNLTAQAVGINTPAVRIPSWPYVGETKNDRLWEHVARIQEHPGTYVCGAGTASYLNPHELHGWKVDLQQELDESLPDRFQSVLYFLGKYDDPLGEMMRRFKFVPLHGEREDGAVLQTGHSSGERQGSI